MLYKDGSMVGNYLKLKALVRKAEIRSFPLLYLYSDNHEPSGMGRYLQYNGNSIYARGSSNVSGNMVKLTKMT